jgi:glycosyltransferase involved in cell wall biosynthesis
MNRSSRQLAVVASIPGCRINNDIYVSATFGRIVDALAAQHQRLVLSVPLNKEAPSDADDYVLRSRNIDLIAQPYYRSHREAILQLARIAGAYSRVCRASTMLFVRGLCPFIALLYAMAWWRERRVCHWIVGDPIALLRSHSRDGFFADVASLCYAHFDRACVRLGRKATRGAILCNGRELGNAFRSPRTHVCVSSTISKDEIHEREDTCKSANLRILFVGHIRPEKGIEYLLEALPLLNLAKPFQVDIVGGETHFVEYRNSLHELCNRLRITDRIRWSGHIPFGQALFTRMKESDMLVLPSLSEGTPRVLVEARANGLPIIATNVGGIPTSVTDGTDAILVSPRDPHAIKAAIERVANDDVFRRSLIRNGFGSVRSMTIERFVAEAIKVLNDIEDNPYDRADSDA